MQDKKNRPESGFFDMIVYSMMGVAVVYVIVQCILKHSAATYFKVTLGIWILLAVIVSDFVSPMVTGKLNNKSKRELGFTLASLVLDGAGFMGLYVFIINIGFTKEVSHYIFLVVGIICFALRFAFSAKAKEGDGEVEELPEYLMDSLSEDNDDEIEGEPQIEEVEVHDKEEEEPEEEEVKVLVYRERDKK